MSRCARLARAPGLDVVGAALAGIALFARVLLSDRDFLGSGTDLVTMEAPLASFASHWLRKGILPLWNPFIAGGVPAPAATGGFFSPPFLLGLLLSDAAAIKVRIAISLAVAGAGGAWLCRPHVKSRLASFVGGALFATSGFMAAHLYAGHLELVAAAAFAPWIVGIVDRMRRGDGARLAWGPALACAGLAWLAAHYQMVALGALAAALFVVAGALFDAGTGAASRRASATSGARALGVLGALVLGGALVAAVQVLPLAEVLPYTQRQTPGPGFAASFPAAPLSLVSMLLPGLLDRGADLPFAGDFVSWEAFGYVGLVTLTLGAFAIGALPRTRWGAAATCAAIGALLALGDRTPLLRALCAVAPPFGRFRAAGRYLILVALFAALLAAMGLDAFLSAQESAPRRRHLAGPVGLAAAAFALAVALTELPAATIAAAVRALSPADPAAMGARWAVAVERLQGDAFVSVIVLGAAVAALVLGAEPARRVTAGRLLAAAAVVDTMRIAMPFLATAPHATFAWAEPLVEHLREAAGPGGRVIPLADLGAPDLGAPYELASPTGYSIFLDDRYARFMNRAAGRPLDAFATVAQSDGSAPLLRHLGVRLVLTGAVGPASERAHVHLGIGDFHLVGGMARLQVLAADTPVPRAVLVHAVAQADELDAYARMEDPAFDLRSLALVESPPSFDLQVPRLGAQESATITRYEPDEVGLRVEAAAPALLVLSDVYEPGWTALVDGAPASMGPVDRVMRGVPVGAGSHEVVMRYRPPGLVAGEWLSALGLLVVCGLGVLDVRRLRARAQGSSTSEPNASGT